MKWTEEFKVRFHETDMNEVVTVPNIFKYIQEVAMTQISSQSPTYKELLAQNKTYILSTIRVDMYQPICYGQTVDVSTWAAPSRGYRFTRCYDIRRGDEIFCEATSSWALVSITDKSLVKVEDIDLSNYAIDDPVQLEHSLRIHISPELPMSLVGEYTVKYTDIDYNSHMNNTNYASIICNYIPNIENLRIKSIGIAYKNEAKYKETLKIYMAKLDGTLYFKTILPDGNVNIECEVITENLG